MSRSLNADLELEDDIDNDDVLPTTALVRTVTCRIVGEGPLSFSRPVSSPKGDTETHDQHDKRTWREKLHVDNEGFVVIPNSMLKLALDGSAKRRGDKVPGKGSSRFTKHFVGGILVAEAPRILVRGKPIRAEDVKSEMFYVNADGKRGSGTRVWRTFPMIYDWTATFTVHVFDYLIPERIFLLTLNDCGMFGGLGRYAPRVGGTNGRFKVDSVEWATLNQN